MTIILLQMLEHLDKHVGLAHHKDFGWLASCPTNVGTGMRASVHISVPRLKANKSIDEIKAFCKSHDLDMRGNYTIYIFFLKFTSLYAINPQT